MKLSAERLAELRHLRHFVAPFAGPEKAFTWEELQALIDEVSELRELVSVVRSRFPGGL